MDALLSFVRYNVLFEERCESEWSCRCDDVCCARGVWCVCGEDVALLQWNSARRLVRGAGFFIVATGLYLRIIRF